MVKTRDQSLLDGMFARSLALGYKTCDYKSLDNVGYPLVEFEDTQTIREANRTDIKGTVIIASSVWGLQRKRKQVLDMASALFNEARLIGATEGYYWALDCQASGIQAMDDTTTSTSLKRAVVTLESRIRQEEEYGGIKRY